MGTGRKIVTPPCEVEEAGLHGRGDEKKHYAFAGGFFISVLKRFSSGVRDLKTQKAGMQVK